MQTDPLEDPSPDAAFYERRTTEKNPTSDNPEMTGLVRRIHDWCGIEDGFRVLDFGCYDGYIVRRLRKLAKIHGVGIDISPSAMAQARHAADNEGLDGLEFVVSDGAHVPFPNGSFDVVICSEILEHVPDLDAVLAEISRILVKGGRVYATMPNSLSDVWAPFHPLCRRVDQVEGHLRRMTRTEFIAALQSHGLQPTRVRYRGFVLSALWYSTFIYNPRIKRMGISLISQRESLSQRTARLAAFSMMRAYIAFDRLFQGSRRCMGIDAALSKV
ncbi:MAG: class I SAM-dependent methyltransferase [Chloroflexi bacterium]|nr:MAG: class I SAM-dependent methyltransferase [Chloroflexota bacterium]